ncbi:MAG: NUDIX-like domain-containing protein, partial [Dehalobacterium sp.]
MHLIFDATSSSKEGQPLLFAFYQDQLLVKTTENRLVIPNPQDIELKEINLHKKLFIGIINNHPCYTAELAEDTYPGNMLLFSLRKLFGSIEDDQFWAAGRAFQIMNWNRTHLFCGRCGTPTQNKSNEIAKECPNCGLIVYHNMAPAVIVAVIKDNKILLARNKQRVFKHYSVLAGFVEAGESLEDCVIREIMEE